MYSRITGAKWPPAPAPNWALNGNGRDSAHVKLPSDSLEYATTNTRPASRAWIRCAA
ncbi:Uncharacterised protein [Mycobacteroides abscessus subsp. abscessus]|nr:Uncharacterised protein [Mycobacteroides abscessus subsp. abscessus]